MKYKFACGCGKTEQIIKFDETPVTKEYIKSSKNLITKQTVHKIQCTECKGNLILVEHIKDG